MRAKFIGKKPSMGFVPGQVYEIDSYIQYITKVGHVCICIYDVADKNRWCPYDSISGIFKNWRPL